MVYLHSAQCLANNLVMFQDKMIQHTTYNFVGEIQVTFFTTSQYSGCSVIIIYYKDVFEYSLSKP